MIETYKILSGKYDMVAVPNLITTTILTTRGNDLRLQNKKLRYREEHSASVVLNWCTL